MPVKMTGAQFKAWLASDWGPDAMWEEEEYTVNSEPVEDCDEALLNDTDVISLIAGTIYVDQNDRHSPTISAVAHAKKWLKSQSVVTLMVDVPREHADWFVKQIQATGRSDGMAKVTGRIG